MIEIWYRHDGDPPERLALVKTERHANDLLAEYRVSYGVAPGMYRHGKDKLWAGARWDEPKEAA